MATPVAAEVTDDDYRNIMETNLDEEFDMFDDEDDEFAGIVQQSNLINTGKEEEPQKKLPVCLTWFCFRADYMEDHDAKVKAMISELIFYLCFLIIVCTLTFGTTSIDSYYSTKIMTDLFVESENDDGISFQSIVKVEDFWEYIKGPLLKGLYWDHWYNGRTFDLDNMTRLIYYQNMLLGLPRLRQLRVKSSECLVSSEFELKLKPCFGGYSVINRDDSPFGKGMKLSNATAWLFHEAGPLDDFWFWGNLASYSGSGFIQDLPLNKKEAINIIDDLYDSKWIQRGTRVVFITFTMYNANNNLFTVVRLVVEFPATGGAVPKWAIDTLVFSRRNTMYNNIIFVVQVAFVIFILAFTFQEMAQMFYQGLRYVKQFWNFVDLLLIIMSCMTIALYATTYYIAKERIKIYVESTKQENESYIDFTYVAFWIGFYKNFQAITAFIAFIKMFKFIGFNKTMIQLSMTLSSCAKDLVGFFIMFFIVFLAFTQLGFLLFGSHIEDFSTFMSSFYTLFRIVLGDFNFHQLEQANSILGPIFFMLFIFFVFFVLINMFLAIINDTYSEIKSDVAKKPDSVLMSDYVAQAYLTVLGKFKPGEEGGKTVQSSTSSDDPTKADYIITLDEWKANLYVMGFTDAEIEPIFLKYDIDKNGVLSKDEQDKMMADLETRKLLQVQDADNNILVEEDLKDDDEEQEYLQYAPFRDLINRVDRMEEAMSGLVRNVEHVLKKVVKYQQSATTEN